MAYTLWQRFLRFDPADPIWPNRDRYVLSSGHATALLWSMLHLTRVQAVDAEYEVLGSPAVSLDDLKHFRHRRAERGATRLTPRQRSPDEHD